MLGKLLKYEFKATARMFLLMYAALLVVASINALVLPFSDNIIVNALERLPVLNSIVTSLLMISYMLLIAAVIILTLVIIVVRFYRMLGDQGYLWFTLPVTSNQHILSKLICAFVWSVASVFVVCASVGVMILPTGWLGELWRIPDFWQEVVWLGFSPGLWLACGIVLSFVSWLSGVMMFYAAIAIGPNFTKSRLGGSVLAYVLIYIGVQILSTIQMLILAMPMSKPVEIFFDSIDTMSMGFNVPSAMMQLSGAVDQMVLLSTVVFGLGCLALAIVYYFITRHFMTKKLNLA